MLRRFLFEQIRSVTRNGAPVVDFSVPAGDPGLFGPDAICWRIHQDFTAMMIGGVAALMLQALHPRALAGVWDHSNFREDLKGRLGRTSFFISCTTYGGTALAEQTIAHVRHIHTRVRGVAPDGSSYSAEDGDLLTWVHASEVSSFLQAYLTHANPQLSGAEQDRYYAEMAQVAIKLGATDVPTNRAAMAEYLAAQRSQLLASERTHEVIRVLNSFTPRSASQLFIQAAYQLLPPWAAELLQAPRPGPLQQLILQTALKGVGASARWALAQDGVAAIARQRALAVPG